MIALMGRDVGDVWRVESDQRDSDTLDGPNASRDEMTRKVLFYADMKVPGDGSQGKRRLNMLKERMSLRNLENRVM